MTTTELYQKAGQALEAGRAILATWEKDHKSEALPADRDVEMNKHFDEAERLSKQAQAMEKADRLAKELDEPARRRPLAETGKALGLIGADDPEVAQKAANALHRKAMLGIVRKRHHGLNSDEAGALTGHYAKIGRKDFSGLLDEDGGIVVTPEFRTEVVQKERDFTFIRPNATVITTSKDEVRIPTFDFDGTIRTRLRQLSTITPESSTNAFGKIALRPSKIGIIIKISQELLEDADFNIEPFLVEHYAMRMAEVEELLFITGTGTEEPLGILNAGFDTFPLATGSNITPEEVRDIPMNLKAQYRRNARWMMTRAFIKKIRKLRSEDGGPGTGAFLWQPALAAGQPPTLDGFPVDESEFFPDKVAVGVAGDALASFGDWRRYWIADRTDVRIQRLLEKYAETDEIGIKLTKRFDGAPALKDGMTIAVRG